MQLELVNNSRNTQSDTPLSEQEKLAWLQLSRTENVGPITFHNFLQYYGSAGKALEQIPTLTARSGRKKPLKIPPLSAIEAEYRALKKRGGDIICACEPAYPLALATLEDAPPVLSVRGDTALLNKPCLGIVGARNASLNGRKFAEKLATELGDAGQIIASGLARGIDTAAHKGALKTGTIAVVAGGIDVVYPPENEDLYNEIVKHGLIVAESPLGQKPFAQSFPRRNRIVSGLSSGTIVVEATLRSGSLITARLAGEQGRDVMAVPGHPLDPRAAGPNKLIRDGAVLIRSTEDVLESLNDFSGAPKMLFDSAQPEFIDFAPLEKENSNALEEAREILLAALSFTPAQVDEIIRQTGVDAALAQSLFLEAELTGQLQRLPGNRIMLLEET